MTSSRPGDAPLEWFHDVTWDQSWVVTDKRHQRMTLICLTDSD